ncbi:glutamyl-tRNA reductase [Actinobacillus pleuropneumoniae]|nr:glutamyl-tRNA reductase [Actinobacillus pleuropneumoniae]
MIKNVSLLLRQIQHRALAESVVILSTCNRTELYFHNAEITPREEHEDNIAWREQCFEWFAEIHQLEHNELRECIYFKQNMESARHLMRVACGLDSLILGEPQILGQVKQAYQYSENFYQSQNSHISTKLSRLFQRTFFDGKTCAFRNGNPVQVRYRSLMPLAVWHAQIFDNFGKLRFLLVGAGETIELVARYLIQHGAKNIMIANRTPQRCGNVSGAFKHADANFIIKRIANRFKPSGYRYQFYRQSGYAD